MVASKPHPTLRTLFASDLRMVHAGGSVNLAARVVVRREEDSRGRVRETCSLNLRLTGGVGGVEAMQVKNREVFRRVFMTRFLGMAAVSVRIAGYAWVGLSGPKGTLSSVAMCRSEAPAWSSVWPDAAALQGFGRRLTRGSASFDVTKSGRKRSERPETALSNHAFRSRYCRDWVAAPSLLNLPTAWRASSGSVAIPWSALKRYAADSLRHGLPLGMPARRVGGAHRPSERPASRGGRS